MKHMSRLTDRTVCGPVHTQPASKIKCSLAVRPFRLHSNHEVTPNSTPFHFWWSHCSEADTITPANTSTPHVKLSGLITSYYLRASCQEQAGVLRKRKLIWFKSVCSGGRGRRQTKLRILKKRE